MKVKEYPPIVEVVELALILLDVDPAEDLVDQEEAGVLVHQVRSQAIGSGNGTHAPIPGCFEGVRHRGAWNPTRETANDAKVQENLLSEHMSFPLNLSIPATS